MGSPIICPNDEDARRSPTCECVNYFPPAHTFFFHQIRFFLSFCSFSDYGCHIFVSTLGIRNLFWSWKAIIFHNLIFYPFSPSSCQSPAVPKDFPGLQECSSPRKQNCLFGDPARQRDILQCAHRFELLGCKFRTVIKASAVLFNIKVFGNSITWVFYFLQPPPQTYILFSQISEKIFHVLF